MFSKEERETILTFDEVSGKWIVYTNIKRHYTKMLKRGYKLIKEYFEEDRFIDAKFEIPKEKYVTFRFIKYKQVGGVEDEGN